MSKNLLILCLFGLLAMSPAALPQAASADIYVDLGGHSSKQFHKPNYTTKFISTRHDSKAEKYFRQTRRNQLRHRYGYSSLGYNNRGFNNHGHNNFRFKKDARNSYSRHFGLNSFNPRYYRPSVKFRNRFFSNNRYLHDSHRNSFRRNRGRY